MAQLIPWRQEVTARRRMTLPHPGERSRQRARVLFGVEDPSLDQCLAAVDRAVFMQSAGMLPDELVGPRVVIYPDRAGRRISVDQGPKLCACGVSRCARKVARLCSA